MSIGERLKSIREHFELKQVEFASRLSTTQAIISNYEANRRNPDTNFYLKLIEIFQININWLLAGQGDMFFSRDALSLNDAIAILHEINELQADAKDEIIKVLQSFKNR